jgi:biopolymer transport protein ExbD
MRMTKFSHLLLLLILIPLQQLMSSGAFFEKLISDYNKEGITLNVTESIDEFSSLLIEKKILTKADLLSPDDLYDKLDNARISIRPEELGIQFVLPKAPLDHFIENIDILDISNAELSKLALITYYQSYSEKYAEFEIIINENRTVTFQNNDLPISNFESRLLREILDRENQKVTLSNVTFILKADSHTPIEFMNFIMSMSRKMGVRKFDFERSSDK